MSAKKVVPNTLSIMVTGADGFIGRHLCAALGIAGHQVRAVTRHNDSHEFIAIGDIAAATNWLRALENIDVVIHLAARAHILRETARDPLQAFRTVNVAGTKRLAESAAREKIKRFIYISSIGVNGNQTQPDQRCSENDTPHPHDLYAISKWEAEQALMRLSAETEMDVVIVRPPLVYGPHVKGNFATLLNWVYRGIPLPLANATNQRSLIGVGNLVDFLSDCLTHPAATNQTFLVSDGDDLSTPELITLLAQGMGKHALLLPCPESLLRLAARTLKREGVVDRLFGSLQIDNSKAQQQLGWHPPVSVIEGLRETAHWYLQQQNTQESSRG